MGCFHPVGRVAVLIFLQMGFWERSQAPKSRGTTEKSGAPLS